MQSISLTEMKKLKLDEIRRMGSFEVTADGELLGIFVQPVTPFIADSVRELCVLGEAVRPKAVGCQEAVLEEIEREGQELQDLPITAVRGVEVLEG